MDLDTLRTVLIITLSITVTVLAARRFKRWVLQRHLPAVLHAEVLALDVMYHPARLRVVVKVPGPQRIHTRLLDTAHARVHQWDDAELPPGTHAMDRELPALPDGDHVLEVSTATQRTFRTFRLRSA
ncbi:MAG: hypothetical protein RBT71_13470 [Flavobacteriales bacterium]|jgi:hypothetical protein|nr:hypothetical protein [Flavobacteriales bacterium]